MSSKTLRLLPRRGCVIEPLEARIAPAINHWIGPASGNWNSAGNWSDGGKLENAGTITQTGGRLDFNGSIVNARAPTNIRESQELAELRTGLVGAAAVGRR